MALASEIVFAAALVVVAISFGALLRGRASDRVLLTLTIVLAAIAVIAAGALGVNLVEGFTSTEALLLAAGGVGAAAVAEASLLGLARGLHRLREIERVGDAARAELASFLEDEARLRTAELERTLARERANASHALGEQERQLAEERRDLVARQAERARVELTEAVASVQERLERRLMAWAADLDRGQRELEKQLAELSQRQREAISSYDARLAADAERLAAVSDEQRLALVKLREELQRFGTEFLEEGRAEIELHAAERRRALHEVSERLRARERGVSEQIEREEAEARSRLALGLGDAERRQLAQLERALDRASTRIVEEAERRFDAQIRESREKAGERLGRELEKAIEKFARSAETDVADRITEIARTTVDRLQRRISDVARAAEVQHGLAADHVRGLSERLEEALAAAEERVAALEIELERATRTPE
jgi:hypothetical protein